MEDRIRSQVLFKDLGRQWKTELGSKFSLKTEVDNGRQN